jgi:hypothetical protein
MPLSRPLVNPTTRSYVSIGISPLLTTGFATYLNCNDNFFADASAVIAPRGAQSWRSISGRTNDCCPALNHADKGTSLASYTSAAAHSGAKCSPLSATRIGCGANDRKSGYAEGPVCRKDRWWLRGNGSRLGGRAFPGRAVIREGRDGAHKVEQAGEPDASSPSSAGRAGRAIGHERIRERTFGGRR